MAETGYGQFCPVAMASEILCTRWTMLLVRELISGSHRFNELRRGVPRMSPALLSQRLKDLEKAGIVRRVPGPGGADYILTEAGCELAPVVKAIGSWGQRWIESGLSLENLDPGLLMWDMRRNLNTDPMPPRRSVIQFSYPDQPPATRRWWLIVDPRREIDLCWSEPGFDVDLYVSTSLRTMTEIWLGLVTVARAMSEERLHVVGERLLEEAMQSWLGRSPFAQVERRVS